MATIPTFASTPRFGSVQINNALGTATSAAALSGVAAGTRIREVRVVSGPTTAPGASGRIKVIVNDGANDRVVDSLSWTNSTDTVQLVSIFSNLILPNASHSIRFAVNTAVAAGCVLDCVVMGEDLT